MRAPALYALIFFVSGIVLGTYSTFPAMAYLGVAVITTAASLIYTLVDRQFLSRTMLCCALVASSGFLTSLKLSDVPANHISHFTHLNGKTSILGSLTAEPDIRPSKTFLTIETESLCHNNINIACSGKLRLRIGRPTNDFNYGDRVAFSGYVIEPPEARNPGAFDYRRYLEIRQISAICNLGDQDQVSRLDSIVVSGFIRSLIVPIRDYMTQVFAERLPPESAALLRGLLIGDVRFIPSEVYQRFRDTGTLHVLAASGSNVGYVTITIFLVARLFRLPRRPRYCLAIIGVVIFSFIAYNQPSVVRASVMATVALVGMLLRRDQNWLNTISVAGLIVLAFHPLYLFDLGTQLSFAAAYSLILFVPPLEKLLPVGKGVFTRISRYFLLILIGSLVAQLGVMPILLYHFHTVPLVSFLSNLLIVPLVGAAAAAGIVLIFVSAVPLVAESCASCLGGLLEFISSATHFFDNLNIPPLQIGAPDFLTVMTYYLFLQLALAFGTRSRHFLAFLMVLIIALNAVVWKSVLAGPDEGTLITILDTSKLTTIFVHQSDGKTILVNGGGKNAYFDNGESVVLPFLRYRGIQSIREVYHTTESENNLASLVTICEATDFQRAPDTLVGGICSTHLDAAVRLESDGIVCLFLTERMAVQQLSSVGDTVALLGLDWSYLTNGSVESILELFHPEAIIFTNYVNRYASVTGINELRTKYPQVNFLSTLESGAIEVTIDHGHYSLWTLANSRSKERVLSHRYRLP